MHRPLVGAGKDESLDQGIGIGALELQRHPPSACIMRPELRVSAIRPCYAPRPQANASGCKLITEPTDIE